MSWHRDYALPPIAAVVENPLHSEEEPARLVREELVGYMSSNMSSPRQPHLPEPQHLVDGTDQAIIVGNHHLSLPVGTHASSHSMAGPQPDYSFAYHHFSPVVYSNPAQQMPVVNPRKRRMADDIDDDGLAYSGPASVYGQPTDGTLAHHDDLDMTRLPAEPAPKRAKSSRERWTPAEEKRLTELREQHLPWAEIGERFGKQRTPAAIKKHCYADMHYAKFVDDDRLMLLHALRDYEVKKWKVIGLAVGKPAKACEAYCRKNFSKDEIAGKIKDIKKIALPLPTLEETPEEGA